MKTLQITAVALLLAVAARAQEDITLDRAIETALRQNRDLKVTELSLQSQSLSLDSAEADFGVSVEPNGAANSGSDANEYDYGLVVSKKTLLGTTASVNGQYSDQNVEDAPPSRRGSVTVEVQQPLLKRFGTLVNREPITSAESAVAAARRNVELRKTDLIVQVADTYEEVYRLQEEVAYDEASLPRLGKQLRLMRVREKQGRVTRVDALRVELQHGEAQARLSKSREELESTRAEFADLLGYPVDRAFRALPTQLLDLKVPPNDQAQAIALSNRLDYAQVLQDWKDAQRGVRIARHNLLPDLNLISRYQQYGQGETSSDASSFDSSTWFVGVTAETDLNRTKDRLNLAQAALSEESRRQTVDIVESGIRRQTQQAVLAYDQAHADALFAERNYMLAQTRATLSRRMFEIGRGDSFSMSDAEDALLQARNRMLAAQSEASLAAYRLMKTLGVLIEYPRDLKPRPGFAEGNEGDKGKGGG